MPGAPRMSLHQAAYDTFLGLPGWVHTLLQVLLVLAIGFVVNWVLDSRLDKTLERNRRVDDTTRIFLVRLMDVGIWTFTLVVALSVLGVDPTALAGGLAVGGFIIGFALKDTLGNLAAGIMLVFYRPFNVRDWVTIGGQSGEVVALGMALTTLKSADARIVTMPNGVVLGGTIVNHTREPIRRADVLVAIGYEDDIDTAVKAILAALAADPRVLAEPAAGVRITDLGDDGVGLQVRPWVATSDYWQAQADFHGTVKRALNDAGINIPYPQRDVHMNGGAASG